MSSIFQLIVLPHLAAISGRSGRAHLYLARFPSTPWSSTSRQDIHTVKNGRRSIASTSKCRRAPAYALAELTETEDAERAGSSRALEEEVALGWPGSKDGIGGHGVLDGSGQVVGNGHDPPWYLTSSFGTSDRGAVKQVGVSRREAEDGDRRDRSRAEKDTGTLANIEDAWAPRQAVGSGSSSHVQSTDQKGKGRAITSEDMGTIRSGRQSMSVAPSSRGRRGDAPPYSAPSKTRQALKLDTMSQALDVIERSVLATPSPSPVNPIPTTPRPVSSRSIPPSPYHRYPSSIIPPHINRLLDSGLYLLVTLHVLRTPVYGTDTALMHAIAARMDKHGANMLARRVRSGAVFWCSFRGRVHIDVDALKEVGLESRLEQEAEKLGASALSPGEAVKGEGGLDAHEEMLQVLDRATDAAHRTKALTRMYNAHLTRALVGGRPKHGGCGKARANRSSSKSPAKPDDADGSAPPEDSSRSSTLWPFLSDVQQSQHTAGSHSIHTFSSPNPDPTLSLSPANSSYTETQRPFPTADQTYAQLHNLLRRIANLEADRGFVPDIVTANLVIKSWLACWSYRPLKARCSTSDGWERNLDGRWRRPMTTGGSKSARKRAVAEAVANGVTPEAFRAQKRSERHVTAESIDARGGAYERQKVEEAMVDRRVRGKTERRLPWSSRQAPSSAPSSSAESGTDSTGADPSEGAGAEMHALWHFVRGLHQAEFDRIEGLVISIAPPLVARSLSSASSLPSDAPRTGNRLPPSSAEARIDDPTPSFDLSKLDLDPTLHHQLLSHIDNATVLYRTIRAFANPFARTVHRAGDPELAGKVREWREGIKVRVKVLEELAWRLEGSEGCEEEKGGDDL